jgi:hypothetical protein
MRPKVVFGILLLALGLVGLMVLVSQSFRQRQAPPAADGRNVSRAGSAPDTDAGSEKNAQATGVQPVVYPIPAAVTNGGATNATTMSDAEHEQYVHQRTMELNALAMKNDAVSRDAILDEMQNPDKAIREAALEAAIQFDDRSVVLRLQEIAAQTEDSAEKAAILEAIDYINLPSLTEYREQQKAVRDAMGITNSPSYRGQ